MQPTRYQITPLDPHAHVFEARCTVDDPDSLRASGSGFAVTLQEPPEHFSYRIELRDWAGRRLASHDPQIDNLGPLPTPP